MSSLLYFIDQGDGPMYGEWFAAKEAVFKAIAGKLFGDDDRVLAWDRSELRANGRTTISDVTEDMVREAFEAGWLEADSSVIRNWATDLWQPSAEEIAATAADHRYDLEHEGVW